ENYPAHQVAKSNPILQRIRSIKESEEIDLIQNACNITEKGVRRLLNFVKPGVTEYEIEAELIHEFVRNRSRGFAYTPIIASGANACVLHYIENKNVCQDGELILLDVAAEYANYNADLTRTIPVNGRYTARQRQVYDAVERVFNFAKSVLKPGIFWNEYQKEVEKYMESELIEKNKKTRHFHAGFSMSNE
ncbi:MAG: M24 family metallopeptidase, partial [Aquirufa sp.]